MARAAEKNFLTSVTDERLRLRIENEKLRAALLHARHCQVCAEGDWSDCEAGKESLTFLETN